MNIRKEALERQFVRLLHSLTPSEEFRLLFRDIAMSVWNRKQADAQAELSAIRQRLATLTDRKNSLIDRYLDNKIPEQTYREQDERLSGEIDAVKSALRKAEVADEQIEELLEFADRVLVDPAGLWARASLAQRQRLQQVLFPDPSSRALVVVRPFDNCPVLDAGRSVEPRKSIGTR